MARRKDGRPKGMPASYYSTEEYVRGETAEMYAELHEEERIRRSLEGQS